MPTLCVRSRWHTASACAFALGAVPRALLPVTLMAILSSACTSLQPPSNAERSYAGRFSLAVTHAGIGTDERRTAWSGRFSLAVGSQSVTLDLVSPLGATIARFETDSREARLLLPANGGLRVEHGADAQALSEQVLGWSLPIAGIPDWVEGRPASGRPYRVLPAEQGDERFEQDGWAVTVQRVVDGRPGRRLQMDRAERDGSPAVALRVVLDGPTS